MKKILFGSLLALTAQATTLEVSEIPSELTDERAGKNICVVNHGSTFTRFDRCRINEVMIGVQDLNPITLRCAQLVINCRRSEDYQK